VRIPELAGIRDVEVDQVWETKETTCMFRTTVIFNGSQLVALKTAVSCSSLPVYCFFREKVRDVFMTNKALFASMLCVVRWDLSGKVCTVLEFDMMLLLTQSLLL
jgi:hypothetical protein